MAVARLTKFAGVGSASLALAVAVTVGAPAARADVDFGAVTTGPLFAAAAALGVDTVVIQDVDVIGDITLNLAWSPAIPPVLGDAVNAYPFGGFNPLGAAFKRQPGGTLGAVILAGSGLSAYNAGLAYEALLASAGGATPPGYTPLVPSGRVSSLTGEPCTAGPTCVQGTNITNLAVLQVNNPGTPNGGLYARFGPILSLFGVNPVSAGGESASTTGVAVNAATIGLGLGYNALSDFPVTLNPFSLVNSLLATVLPTYLLGGGTLAGDSDDLLYTRLGLLATLNVASTSYSTFAPDDLPLLEPLRLPARLINGVLGAIGVPLTLPTPLADALEPALEILVNTGYTDVVTPTDGGTYNRTYRQSGDYVPLLSQAPLTPAEWLQVPGDVARALFTGFGDVFFPSAPPASVMPSPPPPAPASVVAASAAPVSDVRQTADVTARISVREARSSTPDASAATTAEAPRNRGAAVRRAASVAGQATTDGADTPDTPDTPSAASVGAISADRDAAPPKRATRSAARASR